MTVDDVDGAWLFSSGASYLPPPQIGGHILMVPVTGGSATPLATAHQPNGLAVDATAVYWQDGIAIYRQCR